MRPRHRRGVITLLVLFLTDAAPGATTASADPSLTETETVRILSHGPWPPDPVLDPSNRVSGNADAIALGRDLFFDPGLSAGDALACASCHQPDKAFTDAAATSRGRVPLHRNAPSVLNLRAARWFGWDGGSDSLWAASIRPLLSADEMATDGAAIAALLTDNPDYGTRFAAAFEHPVTKLDREEVLVATAKALAAYMETLVSPRSAFDHFRDALARGDSPTVTDYPEAARRGLKLFIGTGRCFFCHFGPHFSNGAFADVGIPYFLKGGGVDKGRYGGIQRLKASPYSRLGAFNDRPDTARDSATGYLALQPRNFGEFKVPSLRNVAQTGPYMHDGSLASLEDVVRHYSDLDLERLHSDGEKILRPLDLSEQEIADLVAFLETL